MRFSVDDIFFARTICRCYRNNALKQTLSLHDCTNSSYFFCRLLYINQSINQSINQLINGQLFSRVKSCSNGYFSNGYFHFSSTATSNFDFSITTFHFFLQHWASGVQAPSYLVLGMRPPLLPETKRFRSSPQLHGSTTLCQTAPTFASGP